MKVILNIDTLRDFCAGGSLAVQDGDAITVPVNRLLESGQFDLRVAVQEAHPAGHVSFASSHPGSKPFTSIKIDGADQMLWPDHAIEGSVGGEFHPDLRKDLFDLVFKKGTDREVDSYSAFFDNCGKPTGLRDILIAEANKRGESASEVEVFLTGLALDYCVGWSARDAANIGFKTTVIYDTTRSITVDGEKKILQELKDLGVDVIESRELLGGRELPVARTHQLHP